MLEVLGLYCSKEELMDNVGLPLLHIDIPTTGAYGNFYNHYSWPYYQETGIIWVTNKNHWFVERGIPNFLADYVRYNSGAWCDNRNIRRGDVQEFCIEVRMENDLIKGVM
jgi:hypothetical protein